MDPTFELVRPDDLLHLRIEVVNLKLDTREPAHPALVLENSDQPAHLIVVFPPQTVAEPAYFEASDVKPADDGSVRKDPDPGHTLTEPLDLPGQPSHRRAAAQLGHCTRLVFNVPADTRIAYSVAGLLDWTKLELKVNPIAAIGLSPTAEQIAQAPEIGPPTADETAIEIPYRLVISPTPEVAWHHRADPFVSRGHAELWHTRLQLKTATANVDLSRYTTAPLRAIWSPDYHTPQAPPPFFDDTLRRTAIGCRRPPADRRADVCLPRLRDRVLTPRAP